MRDGPCAPIASSDIPERLKKEITGRRLFRCDELRLARMARSPAARRALPTSKPCRLQIGCRLDSEAKLRPVDPPSELFSPQSPLSTVACPGRFRVRHDDAAARDTKRMRSSPIAAAGTALPRDRTTGSHGGGFAALACALTLAAVMWGSLAFGAVYPWAFWPLAGLALARGLAGLLAAATPTHRTRAVRPVTVSRGFLLALGGVVAAVLLQLIPLPLTILLAVNPNGVSLRRAARSRVFRSAQARMRSQSPHPRAGSRSRCSPPSSSFSWARRGCCRLTARGNWSAALAVFGVVLALVGIIQKPLYAGRIYGFWTPQEAGTRSGRSSTETTSPAGCCARFRWRSDLSAPRSRAPCAVRNQHGAIACSGC